MPAYFEKPLSRITAKWRIFYEESVDLNQRDERTDFEELRGIKDSRIYRHGQDCLAVSSDDNRLQLKLRDILKVPRGPKPVNEWWGKDSPTHLPRAKTGSVLLFSDEHLDMVAGAIRAKRNRPKMSEERRAIEKERLAPFRFGKTRAVK